MHEGRIASLVEAGVRAVKIVVVDNAGVHRVKCVPVGRLAEVAEAGVGMSTLLSVWAVNDAFAGTEYVHPDRPSGDLRLIPDIDACVPLAAEPGWAWAPADQHTQDRDVWPGCSRLFLKRMVLQLAGVGIRMLGAFETEWYFHPVDKPETPINDGPGYSAIAVTGVPFLIQLTEALATAGIAVQQIHPEFSPGQYEVSVGPGDALAAADAAVLVRQVIRGVASSNALAAFFAPKVRGDALGSGMHFHLSLWDEAGKNMFADGGRNSAMARDAEAFAAGILQHLPAVLAVTAPSTVSYSRLRPGTASGAYAAWGYENRETALRFIRGAPGSQPSGSNIEYKPIDGAANPYLAIGCLIAAGLDGIRKGANLPQPTSVAPAALSEQERSDLGITRLPENLGEAICALERSSVLRHAMGDMLHETFLATRRLEWETYHQLDDEDLIRVHRARY